MDQEAEIFKPRGTQDDFLARSAMKEATSSPEPSPRRFSIRHFENRRGEGPGDEVVKEVDRGSHIGRANNTRG